MQIFSSLILNPGFEAYANKIRARTTITLPISNPRLLNLFLGLGT